MCVCVCVDGVPRTGFVAFDDDVDLLVLLQGKLLRKKILLFFSPSFPFFFFGLPRKF